MMSAHDMNVGSCLIRTTKHGHIMRCVSPEATASHALHICIWSGMSYSLCFATIISDQFLTGAIQVESVPAQLAVKVCIGDSDLVTAWQSWAHDLVNAAVPHLIEQQHVEWPLLRDVDGAHYQGLQSLHERKGLLKRPDKLCSWC